MSWFLLAHLLAMPPITVTASREGLIGQRTASGLIIQADSIFVALPSRSALHRIVVVEYQGRRAEAPVLDVGPHNTRDPYWRYPNKRPRAESQKGNHAGIDLSDALWDQLGIPRVLGLVKVTWRFK